MKSVLVLFARSPQKGKVKTRLARTHGDDFALDLARAMLDDTLDLCASIDIETRLFLTPDEFDGGTLWDGVTHPQGEGDLWTRLLNADARLRSEGFEHVIIIGSDSPDLPPPLLRQALTASHDFKVGPSSDGGFYLLGSSRSLPNELFEGVPISSRETCTALMSNLTGLQQKQGVTYRRLPEWHDVDDETSLKFFIDRRRQSSRARHCRKVLTEYGLL